MTYAAAMFSRWAVAINEVELEVRMGSREVKERESSAPLELFHCARFRFVGEISQSRTHELQPSQGGRAVEVLVEFEAEHEHVQ